MLHPATPHSLGTGRKGASQRDVSFWHIFLSGGRKLRQEHKKINKYMNSSNMGKKKLKQNRKNTKARLTHLPDPTIKSNRARSNCQSTPESRRMAANRGKKKKKRTPEIHRFCASSLFTSKPRSNFDFRAPLTLFFGSRAHFISSG